MIYKRNKWQFKELAVWMDGGSSTIYFTDDKNKEQRIDIQQHTSIEYYEELSNVPGRIYVNDEIIDKRSIAEFAIVAFLKEFVIFNVKGLEKDILIEQINWIESKAYVELEPIKLAMSEARKQSYECKSKID